MRPDPPVVLRGIAAALMRQVAPEVSTPFSMGTLGQSAGLLGFIAQEYDRAAARLAGENQALVTLFADALRAGLVSTPALEARLRDAAAVELPGELRVSALQALNDRLRAILVDLHTAIDATPGQEARVFGERIWEELRESTRRRHLERMGR